jgi:ABC-type polysaccharide/polyol phosphate export permease
VRFDRVANGEPSGDGAVSVSEVAADLAGRPGAPPVVADGPPPALRFRRRVRPVESARELFRARELLRTLAERDLRVRYKQAVLGMAWAVLSPVMLMLIFTLLFSRAIKVNTGGAPYPLFAYLGLLPWTFFSTSVSTGGQSLLNNIPLLNKVYCPREVFPLAAVLVGAVDMAVASLVLGILFGAAGFAPRSTSYWVPLLLLVQLAFTIGVALVVSIVIVYLRDLRHALPIILQFGLFATPVAYGLQIVPARLRGLYSAIDPLGPVIDGYRRTVLYGQAPDLHLLAIAAASSLAFLCGGYLVFKKLETRVADVA